MAGKSEFDIGDCPSYKPPFIVTSLQRGFGIAMFDYQGTTLSKIMSMWTMIIGLYMVIYDICIYTIYSITSHHIIPYYMFTILLIIYIHSVIYFIILHYIQFIIVFIILHYII